MSIANTALAHRIPAPPFLSKPAGFDAAKPAGFDTGGF
jgi:hypothetical protein